MTTWYEEMMAGEKLCLSCKFRYCDKIMKDLDIVGCSEYEPKED